MTFHESALKHIFQSLCWVASELTELTIHLKNARMGFWPGSSRICVYIIFINEKNSQKPSVVLPGRRTEKNLMQNLPRSTESPCGLGSVFDGSLRVILSPWLLLGKSLP